VRVPVVDLLPADSPRQAGEDSEHIENLLNQSEELPALVVHRATMRVIDGMHRLEVAIRSGHEHVPVRFFDGTDRDCFPLAVRLNAAHGLPLPTADRIAAAARIVRSHPEWSDRRVAALVGVSPKTVAGQRSTGEAPQLNARIGQDGRVRGPDVARRRRLAADYITNHPSASLREIAREAGLSVGTARKVRLRVESGQDPVPDGRDGRDDDGESTARVVHRSTCAVPPALPEVTINEIVECLRQDPTMRMTECGRVLLRILGANKALTARPTALAMVVPQHHAVSVALAARRIAVMWSQFAEELERTDDDRAAPPRQIS